ncbi:MAG: hypothetical protein Q9187_006490 [Circinaria calcarea]
MEESSNSSFSNHILSYGNQFSSSLVVNDDSIRGPKDKSTLNIGIYGSQAFLDIPRNNERDLLDFIFFLETHNVRVVHPSDVQQDDNQIVGLQGSSMEVFPGTWRSQRVAIKRIRKSKLPDVEWKLSNPPEYKRLLQMHQQRQRDMLFEIKVMARGFFSSHPNIVKLFAVFFEDNELLPSESNIFSPGMIVELADPEYPDLDIYFQSEHRARPMPFTTVANIIADIADGLTALHSHGVIHADLKPSNILLFFESMSRERPIAKIADFGFCGIFTSAEGARGGTSYWNAPEIVFEEFWCSNTPNAIKPSAFYRDIFSFGLVAITTALNGNLPFDSQIAAKLKSEDSVVENVVARLGYDAIALEYTPAQICLLKRLAEDTLRLHPDSRASSLAHVRSSLLGNNGQAAHAVYESEVVPFSALDSLAEDDEERFLRGFQYPKELTQYSQLPIAIVRQLDNAVKSIDLEMTPIPVLAQCFQWACARTSHLGYLDGSNDYSLFEATAEKMQKRARTDKSYSAHLTTNMTSAAADHSLETDLQRLLDAGGLVPSILDSIRLGHERDFKKHCKVHHVVLSATIDPGWGPLHFGAYYNRSAFLEPLVRCGADTDRRGGISSNVTPLAVAALNGNAECVRELIRLGAKVNPPFTGMWRMPLRETLIASDDTQRYVDAVAILLDAGASTDHDGCSTAPIHMSAHLPNTLGVFLKHDPGLVHYRDATKHTPLHYATIKRCFESVQILLRHGADVNATDECGFTPLHWACEMSGKNQTKYHGPGSCPPLPVGGEEDGQNIIRTLRDAGADIDATLFGGMYGPGTTPDSLLYDIQTDVTEETINFSRFTLDEAAVRTRLYSTEERFGFSFLPTLKICDLME